MMGQQPADDKLLPKKTAIVPPAPLLLEIEGHCRALYSAIYPKNADFMKISEDILSPQRAAEDLHRLAESLPTDIRGSKLLEIGSGYGMLVAVAVKEFGIDAFGVEPSQQFQGSFECSVMLLEELGCGGERIHRAMGEALPFQDDSFDVVYSSNVLEHVRDPARVIAEAIRVVRPGGYVCFVVPNYGSWWEGHYGLLWFPGMPKWLGKLYVKLYGRDAAFIDTLNFISHGRLERILSSHLESVEIRGWGIDLWEKRLRTLDFSEWACLASLKAMVRWVHRLKLVETVIWLGKRLHWETPIVLTLQKLSGAGRVRKQSWETGERSPARSRVGHSETSGHL